MTTISEFFGEPISSYSRAQAIEDGILVELPADIVKEAGFLYPVAVTRAVYCDLIEVHTKASRAGNDLSGRTWDVLWMLKNAIRNSNGGEIRFSLYVVRREQRGITPQRVSLRAVCGPGDEMEPVITIMFPEED